MKVSCFFLIAMLLSGMAILSTYGSFNSSKVISKRDILTSCDRGWYPFGDKCYRNGKKKLTWDKAVRHCEVLGGRLASIHSHELSEFLTAFFLLEVESYAWIGLKLNVTVYSSEETYEDETFWVTYENETFWVDSTKLDFTNFLHAYPPPSECCAFMAPLIGYWPDTIGIWGLSICDIERELICQKSKKGKKKKHTDPMFCTSGGWRLGTNCYHLVSERLKWQDAEDYCFKHHDGHLVTIKDFRIQKFLQYILRNYTQDMWIGIKISNEKEQQWSSGGDVVFQDWTEGVDNFIVGTCTVRTVTGWITLPCTRLLPFICERSTRITSVSETAAPSFNSSDELVCPENFGEWRDFGGEFCYYIANESIGWFHANFMCQMIDGTLASFHSQFVLDKLLFFLTLNYIKVPYWIGLFHNGIHTKWVDGSPVNFSAEISPSPEYPLSYGRMHPVYVKWTLDYKIELHLPYICSARKISSNSTTENSSCISEYTAGDLSGVIICILIIGVLLEAAVYYLCFHNDSRKTSIVQLPLRDQVPNHRLTVPIETNIYDDYEVVRAKSEQI